MYNKIVKNINFYFKCKSVQKDLILKYLLEYTNTLHYIQHIYCINYLDIFIQNLHKSLISSIDNLFPISDYKFSYFLNDDALCNFVLFYKNMVYNDFNSYFSTLILSVDKLISDLKLNLESRLVYEFEQRLKSIMWETYGELDFNTITNSTECLIASFRSSLLYIENDDKLFLGRLYFFNLYSEYQNYILLFLSNEIRFYLHVLYHFHKKK